MFDVRLINSEFMLLTRFILLSYAQKGKYVQFKVVHYLISDKLNTATIGTMCLKQTK